MIHRNYLFLALFLLGLTQNTPVFAEKTWFERIKDAFSNGIEIHNYPPLYIRPMKEIIIIEDRLGEDIGKVTVMPMLYPSDYSHPIIRKPFFKILSENKLSENCGEWEYNKHKTLYLMPGDCLLAATILGTAAYGCYKYFHTKN